MERVAGLCHGGQTCRQLYGLKFAAGLEQVEEAALRGAGQGAGAMREKETGAMQGRWARAQPGGSVAAAAGEERLVSGDGAEDDAGQM